MLTFFPFRAFGGNKIELNYTNGKLHLLPDN